MKVLQGLGLLVMGVLLGCQAYREPSSRTVGEMTDDVAITSYIKTQLIRDPDIKGLGINVDVRRGVVSLTGDIPDERVRNKALKIAGSAKGVTSVDDNLRVP